MNENCILVLEVVGGDFEVRIYKDEVMSEKLYFCKGYDSTIDTAKMLRKEKDNTLPVYKQMLGEEAVKVIA